MIPKINGITNPRIGRLRASDEGVVLDVLLVEADVRLGHFGDFNVCSSQLLPQEFNLLLDAGGRALDVHFRDGRRDATPRHSHGQMTGALDWTVHPTGLLDVHLRRIHAPRLAFS